MLGLGLGVSKVSSLRSLAAKLLAKLKSRSTYYENNKDSKQVVQDLNTIDVLDKASILLTPTAYSDARVHSVKTCSDENFLTGNNSTFDTGIGDWINYGTGVPSHSSTYLNVRVETTEGGARVSTNSLITGGQVGKTIKVRIKLWTVAGNSITMAPLFKVFLGGDERSVTISQTPTFYEFILKPTTTADLIIYKTNAAKSNGEFAIDDVSLVDVSSDFDFDRASSATRINSDGLVQDMQSITDPELVLNGDFEELGDDVVNDGDFTLTGTQAEATTGTYWTTGTDWTISGGKAIYTGTVNASLTQSNALISGNFYKLQYEVISSSSDGNFKISGVTESAQSPLSQSVGTHTVYFTADGSAPTNLALRVVFNTTGTLEIDNISVQQVDPNDYWGTGGGWSLEQGAAVATGSSNTKLTQDISANGKELEVTFTISDYGGSGSVSVDFGSTLSDLITSNGTHTVYGNSDQDNFEIFKNGGFTGKISNVSVKDITFSEDVDLARINYDSNGDNGHWLLEPSRTNYATYSSDINEWNELTSDGTITSTSNYALAPNGKNEATRLQLNSTNGYALKSVATTSFNDDYYISIYLKSNTTESQEVTIYGRNSLAISYTVTTQWQKFEVSCNNSLGSAFFNFGCRPSQGSDADLDILAWGGQLEQGTYTTSYIPTYGSTVTRATETLTGSGNSTLINSTEGVLYAEIAKFQDDNDNFVLLSLNNSSDNLDDNTVTIGFDSDDDFFIRVQANNVNVFYSNDQTSSKDVYYKIALSYKSGDSKIYINGNSITPNSGSLTNTFSFSSILDNLSFDYDGNGVLPFYGKVKAVAVFDEALEDDELENLTS